MARNPNGSFCGPDFWIKIFGWLQIFASIAGLVIWGGLIYSLIAVWNSYMPNSCISAEGTAYLLTALVAPLAALMTSLFVGILLLLGIAHKIRSLILIWMIYMGCVGVCTIVLFILMRRFDEENNTLWSCILSGSAYVAVCIASILEGQKFRRHIQRGEYQLPIKC